MPDAEPYYIGSDIYRKPAFGFNHPLNIVRHAAVNDLLQMLGWLDENSFRESQPATIDQLLEFHDRAYVRALQYANATGKVEPDVRERYQVGTFENPLFPGLFERASMTVGGSILSAELASKGHVVFHPSGGTHHGRADRASGFCYFNDPVFAILTLLKQGSTNVLYIDLDAHHGDGVEDAFYEENRVTTLSIHEAERWPFSGKHSRPKSGAYNLAVPRGINDSEFDYLVENAVLPLADKVRADALVLCCGADCLAGDPLSKMELSNVALWDAVDSLIEKRLPTVILGGGGYNPWTVTRYWAGMWGRISGQAFPERLPQEAVDYLREMECDLIDEEDVEEAWLTTLADIRHTGPVRDEIKLLVTAA
ncbi:MAG: acetoin utilization protein AcuC [Gammaproteobacteria bacterium]|jgi:acetoin utilization protein AcuC|nr:acetoin utilization protein AcuC [Gammaproteobacteria bacterium]